MIIPGSEILSARVTLYSSPSAASKTCMSTLSERFRVSLPGSPIGETTKQLGFGAVDISGSLRCPDCRGVQWVALVRLLRSLDG